MYETITVQELPNRASNAYFPGCCGIPETPDQFFSVQYQQKDGSYWNGFESEDEQKALAELERYNKMGGVNRIVLVVKQAQPVIEESVQSEPVEEVQEVVEQNVEASEASTDEQPEVVASGKFEVEVSAVGKPFIAYRGDSLEVAKATVTAHIGKCLRVQTRVHLSASESFWVYPGKRANGLAWDSHDQWLSDLHAGAFDKAYARDYVNDLVLQGKQQEAERDAAWFRERGINV